MKHRLHETLPEACEELARRMLGSRTARWERVREGVSTRVYRITHGGERFYLRILPEAGVTFAPEVRVHQLAREMGCMVPEVLHYEARYELLDRSVMLTSEIPGRPLAAGDDPSMIREAIRAAGRDLGRINSIPVNGFGWVRRDSTAVPEQLDAEHPALPGLLEAEYARSLDALPLDAVPGVDDGTLREAAQRALRLVGGSEKSHLVHGDFDTSHIFVNNGRYAGIIDLGEIRGMPEIYDLGHHQMHDRERLPYSTIGWLLDGYSEITSLPKGASTRIAAWSILIAIRALARGLQRSSESQIVETACRAIRLDAISLAP